MAIGVVGRKSGMTRVFNEDGSTVPVTVIEVEPNRITQIKTVENDGYNAVQVTTGDRKVNRVTKPEAGHFAKAGTEAGRGLWEFRLADAELGEVAAGGALTVTQFEVGQKVDVTGVSKGRGFQGVVRRWHFAGGDATHGNSLSHRTPGSIGQRQTPGRVFKNMKMAGHMGDRRATTQNLVVVRVDAERNLLLIKGSVPGSEGTDVLVRPAVKS
jgi:large subunit ribosomal protein L3